MIDVEKRKIGAIIKKAREEKGWTYYRISVMLKEDGCSRKPSTELKKIEEGDGSYRIETLIKYLDILGLSLDVISKEIER